MEKKLVVKMIKNCCRQYYEGDSALIGNSDLEELTGRIFQIKEEDPTADLYEIVNDVVYEFLAD